MNTSWLKDVFSVNQLTNNIWEYVSDSPIGLLNLSAVHKNWKDRLWPFQTIVNTKTRNKKRKLEQVQSKLIQLQLPISTKITSLQNLYWNHFTSFILNEEFVKSNLESNNQISSKFLDYLKDKDKEKEIKKSTISKVTIYSSVYYYLKLQNKKLKEEEKEREFFRKEFTIFVDLILFLLNESTELTLNGFYCQELREFLDFILSSKPKIYAMSRIEQIHFYHFHEGNYYYLFPSAEIYNIFPELKTIHFYWKKELYEERKDLQHYITSLKNLIDEVEIILHLEEEEVS